MIIGVTGSSGAGKSTVCEFLENNYKVKIINADKISKKLSKKGTSYVVEIIEKFGKDIVNEEGELKRKKLAEIIYNNPEKRELLNKCTFKYIIKEIKAQIKKVKDTETTIIIDAPLLFESGLNRICDKIIGVISNRDLQIERIVARDNIDYEDAEKRLNAQQSNKYYIQRCDKIIENNKNLKNVFTELEKVCKEYEVVLTNTN